MPEKLSEHNTHLLNFFTSWLLEKGFCDFDVVEEEAVKTFLEENKEKLNTPR